MATSVLTITTPRPLDLDPDATRESTILDQARQLEAFISGTLAGGGSVWLSYDSTSSAAKASETLTFASVGAGYVIRVNGVDFRAVSGTPVRANNEFKRGVTNTADAADFVTTFNACTDARVSGLITATSALAVVTLTAQSPGVRGNQFTVETLGIMASGTVTLSSATGTVTVTINGVAIAVTAGATDTATALLQVAAVNASSDALVSGFVQATSAAGVLTLWSLVPGARGNTITLTSSAGGGSATASGARLTGGTLVQWEGVQASGTITISGADGGTYRATINGVNIDWTGTNGDDTATAATGVAAINGSTDALVRGLVYASNASGVLTVTAVRGGKGGNAITLAKSGTGTSVSGARLTGGAAPTQVVLGGTGVTASTSFPGARMAGGVGGGSAPISFVR